FECWAAFATFFRLFSCGFDLAEELAPRHFAGPAFLLPLSCTVTSMPGTAMLLSLLAIVRLQFRSGQSGPCTETSPRSRRAVNPLLAITAQPRTNQCLLLERSPVANMEGTDVRI